MSRQPGAQRNTTAERAIDLLLLFDERTPSLTAAQLAEKLGMSRSTTYRYIQSLRDYGLLEEDTDRGGFRLGMRILQLAKVVRIGLGLSEIALPVMRELSKELSETVLLTKRNGNVVLCVERVEPRSSNAIHFSYERGQAMPVHADASAKVLLAWALEEDVSEVLHAAPLERFTDTTVTEPNRLRSQLETIRNNGYAVSNGEVDPSVRGVAAPIFAPDARIVAGISVVGPTQRLTDAQLPRAVEAVRRAAKAITRHLEEIDG